MATVVVAGFFVAIRPGLIILREWSINTKKCLTSKRPGGILRSSKGKGTLNRMERDNDEDNHQHQRPDP